MYKDIWMKNVTAISVHKGCCSHQAISHCSRQPPPWWALKELRMETNRFPSTPPSGQPWQRPPMGGPNILAPPFPLPSSPSEIYLRGCLPGLSPQKVRWIKHNFSAFRLCIFFLQLTDIYSSFIYNSQKLERDHVSINRNVQTEVYSYTGIQAANKKELSTDTQNSMDESQKYYVE